MSEITIFEKIKGKLYAAKFKDSKPAESKSESGEDDEIVKDEYDRALDDWRDVIFLREFFRTYSEDLKKFEPSMKQREAVIEVFEEAESIFDRLNEFSEHDNLDELFKPLYKSEKDDPLYEFQKVKTRGEKRNSMLRLYAVKFRDGYVIAGSGIKLTQTMNERPHLKAQLYKLERVKIFLEGENPETSFFYLETK